MGRIIKVILASVVLSVLLVFPAFAQEVTDPTTVIKSETLVNELSAHHATVEKQLDYFKSTQVIPATRDAHVAVVEAQLKAYEKDRANNYLLYLDRVIYNLDEVVRIKKEIVTNYTWLSQYNPYYATLIPTAQADVEKAQAWVDAYKAYKDVTAQDFAVRYP